MSFLDQLTIDQRQLLVSLPYRVGLCVSQSDTSGGDESDEEELRTLSNILIGFAGEMFGCETVQYIISETLRQKERWNDWQEGLETVAQECGEAVQILSEHVDEKEVNGFKRHLMEVGEAVALAFREVGSLSFLEEMKLKILYNKLKHKAQKEGVIYKSYEEFLNISADERRALESLAQALHIKYAI